MLKGDSKNIPSKSPTKAEAKAVIEQFARLSEVGDKYIEAAEEIAENIFSYLIEVPDAKILAGEIPVPDQEEYSKITQYIKPLNQLFRLAKGSNGSVKHLDRALLSDKELGNPLIEMIIKIRNDSNVGNELLDILCAIVDQEISDIMPKTSLQAVEAKEFFNGRNVEDENYRH